MQHRRWQSNCSAVGLKYCLGALLLAFLGSVPGLAQERPDNPLAGKQVGIYLSKEGFSFTQHYNEAFAMFLQKDDSLDLTANYLKLGATIRLGNYLTKALERQMGVRQAYFVNSRPAFGRKFVQMHEANTFKPNLLQQFTKGTTDYFLLIDRLDCNTVTRRSFYTISNQIRSQRRTVKVVTVQLRLIDGRNGNVVSRATVEYDREKSSLNNNYLNMAETVTPSVRFLDDSLSMALDALFREL
jgi:hypothetical protein